MGVCTSMCLCWEERERRLNEAKMLSLLSQPYELNWLPSRSLSPSICVSDYLCTVCMYVLQHSICSLSLPLLSLSLPANVPSLPLLPLIHLFRAADCLLPESVLPTGLREGGREGGKGKRGRIQEGWGVIVSHVEHVQCIYFKWKRHTFVPLKWPNELHSWFSAHYLAWDHSES